MGMEFDFQGRTRDTIDGWMVRLLEGFSWLYHKTLLEE